MISIIFARDYRDDPDDGIRKSTRGEVHLVKSPRGKIPKHPSFRGTTNAPAGPYCTAGSVRNFRRRFVKIKGMRGGDASPIWT